MPYGRYDLDYQVVTVLRFQRLDRDSENEGINKSSSTLQIHYLVDVTEPCFSHPYPCPCGVKRPESKLQKDSYNSPFNMNYKQNYLWLLRALDYAFKYYVLEKPRGLDFSKRSRDKKSSESSSGYSLTSKKALKNILKGVPIDKSSKFIDVGGGKGGTAIFALDLGFKDSASLEFEEYLHKIAEKNVRTLNLQDCVKLIHADAFKYKCYSEFSHIFMFRPINGVLMKDLLSHIKNSLNHHHKKVYFLIYGGVDFDYIQQTLLIEPAARLIKDELCPYRGNPIRVVVLN
jgi:hypothetical protein